MTAGVKLSLVVVIPDLRDLMLRCELFVRENILILTRVPSAGKVWSKKLLSSAPRNFTPTWNTRGSRTEGGAAEAKTPRSVLAVRIVESFISNELKDGFDKEGRYRLLVWLFCWGGGVYWKACLLGGRV